MSAIIPLSVAPKPTVDEQARRDCIDILRKALARAEAGEVKTVLVIMCHPDNHWSDERSLAIDFPEAIGRLEIVQQAWITSYLQCGCEK